MSRLAYFVLAVFVLFFVTVLNLEQAGGRGGSRSWGGGSSSGGWSSGGGGHK